VSYPGVGVTDLGGFYPILVINKKAVKANTIKLGTNNKFV